MQHMCARWLIDLCGRHLSSFCASSGGQCHDEGFVFPPPGLAVLHQCQWLLHAVSGKRIVAPMYVWAAHGCQHVLLLVVAVYLHQQLLPTAPAFNGQVGCR
jgi:hypothetical protein